MDSKQPSPKEKDAAVAVSSPRLRPVVLLKRLTKSYEGCLQESSDSADAEHGGCNNEVYSQSNAAKASGI
uniref:Uncharacterized protein n=1 Tax=Helianthus annuus TaxID=4232 RepID=A0A251U8N4_HELAN